jgi:GTP-binding protein HflX
MARLHWVSDPGVERVFLVGAWMRGGQRWDAEDSLDELEQLARTAGAEVSGSTIVRMATPHPASFIGRGKAEELAELAREGGVATVIFDEDLAPVQARNLEELIGAKIIDRTQLILDIFAQHARTREGALQIELAQLEYLLPRLRNMWSHLERQQGGIGLRGPGEKQLEVDRRRIVNHIGRLKVDLEQVRARRSELRRGRRRHGWALITLVGYTNAGKSTLLNRLTGAGVLADPRLFATLDPTTRQLQLPNRQMALVTDTVGFIRKLPHDLVESFKATLEEVNEADLLLHVIDASHPRVEKQMDAVQEVLCELGAHETPILPVFNKIDEADAEGRVQVLEKKAGPGAAVSALTGAGLDALVHLVADRLRERHARVCLRVPLAEGKILSQIRSDGNIMAERYEDGVVLIEASLPRRLSSKLAAFAVPAL